MKKVVDNWYLRQFTWMGKTLIINALMGSLFVYPMTVSEKMTKKELKQIDEIIRDYFWQGKRSKIALSVLRNSKNMGGLKLVDFKAKEDVLKISWINRIQRKDDFKYIYDWLLLYIGDLVWSCNLSEKHAQKLICMPSHWKNGLLTWCKHTYTLTFVGQEVRK